MSTHSCVVAPHLKDSLSTADTGKYGRMFSYLPALETDEEYLLALGRAGSIMDVDSTQDEHMGAIIGPLQIIRASLLDFLSLDNLSHTILRLIAAFSYTTLVFKNSVTFARLVSISIASTVLVPPVTHTCTTWTISISFFWV